MFYKIILDKKIVDAQEGLRYVRANPRNSVLLSCKPDEIHMANGILSSDDSVIWHLEGLPEFSCGDYDTVQAVEIEEDEYISLLDKLGQGSEIENPNDENNNETEPDNETNENEEITETDSEQEVLERQTTIEVMLKLDTLTKQVADLKSENEMLSDCLIEMSEIVYG